MTRLALILALLPLRGLHAAANAPDHPATQPSATVAHDKTVSVHRGDLTTSIDAQGYIEPVDGLEVRVRPKVYSGELTIASAAANGAQLQKGQTILQIDPAAIDRQIAAAGNEAVAAHATFDRAQADSKLGREQDELAMQIQLEATRQAQEAVKWFETVDGPNMLKEVELELKNARANVDDQQDELVELQKMYKSQDLTTDTADIVVKRAVRRLEVARESLKIEQQRADKTRQFTYPSQRQHVLDAAKQARQQLESLKIAQAHGKIVRETGLKSAHAAADAADLKLADLEADRRKLTIRAPADGVVYYGQFANGAFAAVDPDSLAPGERITAQQVVMTFYSPEKVRLHLDLPAQKFFELQPGTKGTVSLDAFADRKLEGICDDSLPIDINTAEGTQFIPMYHMTVSLPDAGSKLLPGLRANFHADVKLARDAVLVPSSAIADGCVWVQPADARPERRKVVAGKTNGKQTEIRQGLTEGDVIFVEARK